MEIFTSKDWSNFWIYASYITSILVVLRLLINDKPLKVHNFIIYFISAAIIIYFTLEPIALYSDKWNYKESFENLIQYNDHNYSDIGFYILNKLTSFITDSNQILFLVIAFLYLLGYILFINKYFSKHFKFTVFFLAIISLGFYGYGTNTLKQGLGLSMFLIALSYDEKKIKALLFSILAVLFHKSLIIPVVALWVIKKYPSHKKYIYVWTGCLVLTILFGSTIGTKIGDFLLTYDARIEGYLYGENETYDAGFKLNFLLYSIAPIIYGIYILKKIKDNFYQRIFSLYILVNAIWLIVIRIPFSDRFAYLSWFLIPFILIYPLSKKHIFKRQHSIIALIVFYLASISFFIS